jgi:DNA-binding IclR family transcriptional regulator
LGNEGPGDGTVGKALDVLDMVAAMGRPVRFTELLAESPYPKATLYRFLQTLTNQGMLAYDPANQFYSMGVRLVRLAHAAWAQSRLAPIAGKVGPAYCTGVGKAMLAHLGVDALEAALSRQSFHRFTAHTLTSRAALLAELQVIRDRGYSFDNEEHEPGIICIALPILTRAGRVIGALSVTSTTARSTLDGLATLAPAIRGTAEAIAGEAETWRFPEQG